MVIYIVCFVFFPNCLEIVCFALLLYLVFYFTFVFCVLLSFWWFLMLHGVCEVGSVGPTFFSLSYIFEVGSTELWGFNSIPYFFPREVGSARLKSSPFFSFVLLLVTLRCARLCMYALSLHELDMWSWA